MRSLIIAAALAASTAFATMANAAVLSVDECTAKETDRLQYHIVPDDMADYFNYIWVVDPDNENLVRFDHPYFEGTLGSLESITPDELELGYVHTVFQWFANNHVADHEAPIRIYLKRLPETFVDPEGRYWRDVPVEEVNVHLPRGGGVVLSPIDAATRFASVICKLRAAELT